MGHRRQRPGHGLSATPATTPAPASPSPATPPPAKRFSTASSSSTPRARTSSPACAPPSPSRDLKKHLPDAFAELERIRQTLESHFKDVQDFEFTIQDGKLFMLQTRNGKRTGVAAVRFAVEMVKEKLIDWKTAIIRVPADQLDQVLAPIFDRAAIKAAKAHRHRPARRPRRRLRQESISTPTAPPSRRRQGREGAARPHRDLARGSARHDRRRGHPHRPRRRLLARRARRPPDGQGLRLRRRRASRSITRPRPSPSAARRFNEGDFLSIDGTTGTVYAGEVQDRPLRSHPGPHRQQRRAPRRAAPIRTSSSS